MSATENYSTFQLLLPELLHHVLKFIRATGHNHDSNSPISRENKRYLSSCSLTCKFWAKECRSFIFDRITIRSHKDLRELAAFLRSPTSTIARYVTCLEIEESGAWTCLHTVPTALYRRLPRLQTLELRCGPISPSYVLLQLWPTRTNFPRLPHATGTLLAYRRGFQSVTTLILRKYRFRDFGTLLRLVGAFSALENLSLDTVTWQDTPRAAATDFRTLPLLSTPTLRTVSVTSSQNVPLESVGLLWLFGHIGNLRGGQRSGLLYVDEIPALVDLARFVLEWRKEDPYMRRSFIPPEMQFIVFEVDAKYGT